MDSDKPSGVESGWEFKQDDSSQADSKPQVPDSQPEPTTKQQAERHLKVPEPVTWRATEFVEHEKNIGWYMALMAAAVVAAALVFLATRDKVSSAMIVVVAIIFGIYAARKPRVLEYHLNESGLKAGNKFYSYDQFRSFAVIDEGTQHNITLLPLKRFALAVTLYYAPQEESDIVDMLGEFLPMENHDRDIVDRFLHRIGF